MAIHNALPNTELHEPKGVLAAAINQVYVTDGASSGTYKAYTRPFSNLVTVESLADFPTPIAGEIKLVDGTFYRIRGLVDIGVNFFTLASGEQCSMDGFSQFQDGLTYTGITPMFVVTVASLGMRNMQLNAGTSVAVKFDNVSPAVNNLTFEGVNFNTCSSVVQCTDVSLLFFHTCQFNNCTGTKALEFFGTNSLVLMTTCIVNSYADVLFDLGTATFSVFKATNTQIINGVGSTVISGAAGSANIAAGGRGSLVDNEFFGLPAVLVGLTDKDLGWKFDGNNTLKDSQTRGMLHFTGNTDATVISTLDTYTTIDNGSAPPTFILDATSARVSQTSNDTLEIDEPTPFDARCQANVSIRTVSGGGDKEVAVAIFESTDGGTIFTQVGGIESSALVGTSGGTVVVSAPINASATYQYRVEVKNVTDITNLEVTSIQFYLG
ncbi:MAG: hypothetical protein V3S69_05290 [Dehalococcoidales bacterium]